MGYECGIVIYCIEVAECNTKRKHYARTVRTSSKSMTIKVKSGGVIRNDCIIFTA
jgi:hypothetical protein